MELKFKREEVKYELVNLDLSNQDGLTMVEIFVKTKLKDEAQEVFYTELDNKDITLENVKNALLQAVITQVSVTVLKDQLEKYEANPEEYQEKINKELQKQEQFKSL